MNEQVQEQATSVASPLLKIATAWAAVGITSWAEAASALAFVYTLCLLCEWWWKRFFRPFAENRGWLPRKRRRKDDEAETR